MALLPIGQILINDGVITKEQLSRALEIQQTSGGKKLGDILINLHYITQKDFMKAFSKKLMIDFVDLSQIAIDVNTAKILGEKKSQSQNVIAYKLENNVLSVATDNPLNFYQFDDIQLATGYDVKPVLATTQDIKEGIEKTFQSEETKEVLASLNAKEVVTTIDELDEEIVDLGEKIDSAPVVRLANKIIIDSFKNGVSDIHIEPGRIKTRIRVRIDGELVEQLSISKAAHEALITRLKILSNLNIAEKRIPQDGRYSIDIEGKMLDLRVSTLPTVNGEKMVIRLLGSDTQKITKLIELGMNQSDLDSFTQMLKYPNGIILVTGPTGSGKTTTLYAALDEIAKPNINVVTIEDPVEKNMDGINQVHINVKAGLTFAEGLRSILRQDPDVVMVGEIRDGETAAIAVRAAITGHLVLSTIHTNDAVSTISRLVDMGVEPYLVSSSLVGVVAQRLVKLCCPYCAKDVETNSLEMKLLGISKPTMIKVAVGCEECSNTGYKGRTAIYEMITISKVIKKMITNEADEAAIKEQARLEGASFLRESVSRLVLEGKTDIRQLIKTTYGMDD
ncbi:GspE/PulE family protein [Paludicola sp. MB14-C6]|uniref:GspE/PulE family protein n=1 Tax=Paludihabitans sp. MB14-C6 TaxID=3070656 RepID=UPI0027DDDD84|nr:GspE/PulE family protein [Paludicola sp. MB14-C6]WMJ22103.1 GspE/PulE family protein [Paludicola sp. MB14-C6]